MANCQLAIIFNTFYLNLIPVTYKTVIVIYTLICRNIKCIVKIITTVIAIDYHY